MVYEVNNILLMIASHWLLNPTGFDKPVILWSNQFSLELPIQFLCFAKEEKNMLVVYGEKLPLKSLMAITMSS